MHILPAIDLRNGKVVRLYQGDYDKMTVYEQQPVEAALAFQSQGASHLHVVDLDGAKDGALVNIDTIRKIVRQSKLITEVGGGIRDEQRIRTYLDLGVARVILGTVAVTDYGFVQEMARKYPDRIAVGVDAKDGCVAINGWKEITQTKSIDFCEQLVRDGVKTIIYTDISKDGGLSGTNLEVYRQLVEIPGLQLIASGGVTFEREITELKRIGVYGAILGKALYDGKLSLRRAIELAGQEEEA